MWWRRRRAADHVDTLAVSGPRGRRALLASSIPREQKGALVAKGLPGEGTVYDNIKVTNFFDLDKNKFTASLEKSIRSNVLSKIADADLPAKVTIGGKLGTLWFDGVNFDPVGKVGLTIRLLDLGGSDARQAGYLRFKAAKRTNGRSDHGFEIDRKIAIFNMRHTTLYGNVGYRTNNRANGVWKTSSSFGVHQALKLVGVKCAVRVGMTPEGEFVTDLRL